MAKIVFTILFGIMSYGTAIAQNIYFGDLHVHSELSFDCKVNIDSLYKYAINIANLDFIAVTDHDYLSSEETWTLSKKKANQFYDPFRFVSFIAYEYTKPNYEGHKIIIYKDKDNLRTTAQFSTEPKLFSDISKNGGIIIIAHPDYGQFPSKLGDYDSETVRGIEITNGGNVTEFFGNKFHSSDQIANHSVQNWLEENRLLGFMGVSDSHGNKPGQTGLTAVLADSLTRNNIFEAIKKRHVYATTGAKIILNFRSGNFIMGDSVKINFGSTKSLRFYVRGISEIASIELIKNNKVIHKYLPLNTEFSAEFSDADLLLNSYYYLRVTQKDGNMAWSSPIYFSQNIIANSENNKTEVIPYFELFQNYPNPFNSITQISYNLPNCGFVTIKLYDILGKEVDILTKEYLDRGIHKISFDSSRLSSGIYFYELILMNSQITVRSVKKMTLIQ